MSSSHSIEGLKGLFDTLEDDVDNMESVLECLCVQKDDLDNHCISPTDDCLNYTPLQFGSKWGLVILVKILLQSNVKTIHIPQSAAERLKKEAKSSLHKLHTNNSPTVETRSQDRHWSFYHSLSPESLTTFLCCLLLSLGGAKVPKVTPRYQKIRYEAA